jgi:hypothetical protein
MVENINFDGSVVIPPSTEKNLVPNLPLNPTPAYTDYFSAINALQQILIQRQLEFQDFFLSFFKVKNPIFKLLIILAIIDPKKSFEFIKNHLKNFLLKFLHGARYTKSILYKKTPPKKISIEVGYICENQINHLFVALDYYLKVQCKVKTDMTHTLIAMKTPIEGSKVDKTYTLMKSQPHETTTELEHKGYKISFSKTSRKDMIYTPNGEIPKQNYIITLWSYDCKLETLEELCQLAMNKYAKSKVDDVWVQKMFFHEKDSSSPNGSVRWNSKSMERNKRKINTVILKNTHTEEFMASLNNFVQSEEFYLSRGIPYKLGYLFYGPPGTGKSSMIKSMSFETKRHIHYLSLSDIESDAELNTLMNNIQFQETIIVLEDIDAMTGAVHTRKGEASSSGVQEEPNDEIILSVTNGALVPTKKEKKKTGITLSGLLNQIDGVSDRHGMILVMTTNFPEKLDEALIRDGRVDYRIFFGFCDHEQIYKLFKNFYNGELEVSMADIQKAIKITEEVRIAPCTVENVMKLHYKDSKKALFALKNACENVDSKTKFENF